MRGKQIAVRAFAEGRTRADSFSFFLFFFSSPDARPRSMDSPGQFAIDIKEFAGRIVALEALGKPAKSPVPRVTGPEICALVSRAPMYRERLGGIKGMRPAGSLGPISLYQGSTFLDVPCDFVVRTIR